MKYPQSLILASTSVYRRELLTRLRIPFESLNPKVDETPVPQENALALTTRLARAKSLTVAVQRPDALTRARDAALREFVDTTRVTFRTLDVATIERYVRLEELRGVGFQLP